MTEGQTIQWPNGRGTDNTVAKWQRDRQYSGQMKKDNNKSKQRSKKTLYRKLKIEQHEHHYRVDSVAPEG
jgi:hypothetical protein